MAASGNYSRNGVNAESLITDNFDIWTTAIKAKSTVGRGSSKKLELHGIKKLRELILELAVRGLLVPQEPNDEPATELLKIIAAEKAKMMKEGKIKKQKTLSLFSEEEELFKLPKSWSWQRLGEIGEIFNGNSINASVKKRKYTNISGVPFIATKDVGYGFEELDYKNGVAIPAGEDKFKIAKKGSVLICAEGGSAGKKCGIAEKDIYFGNKLFANVLYGSIDPKYILSLFLSPSFFERLSESMTGIIGGISRAKFIALPAPIPPLKEQRRIVAKIDELMALCHLLEQQTEASVSAHQTLVQTLLEALTNASKRDGFNQAWSRVAEHFDTLFTTEWSVDQLKQSILQLAVMGKLVPQDPNDEPASVLLKKIATEKEKLIKEGTIKKQKVLPPIGEDEFFELPEKWEWSRFANIICQLKYGTSKKCDYKIDGDPVLRIPNVAKGLVDSSDLKFAILEDKEKQELSLKEGDILIIRSNGSVSIVGRSTVVDTLHIGFMYAGYLVRARLNTDLYNPFFLKLLLDSKLIRDQIELPIRTTSGVKNINSTEIGSLIMPTVPLLEQHRIVTKVGELMAVCDALKTHIDTAKINQLKLADAITKQALN